MYTPSKNDAMVHASIVFRGKWPTDGVVDVLMWNIIDGDVTRAWLADETPYTMVNTTFGDH